MRSSVSGGGEIVFELHRTQSYLFIFVKSVWQLNLSMPRPSYARARKELGMVCHYLRFNLKGKYFRRFERDEKKCLIARLPTSALLQLAMYHTAFIFSHWALGVCCVPIIQHSKHNIRLSVCFLLSPGRHHEHRHHWQHGGVESHVSEAYDGDKIFGILFLFFLLLRVPHFVNPLLTGVFIGR